MPEPSARRALELCLSWDVQLMIFAGSEVLVEPAYKKFLETHYPFPAFHEAATVTEDLWGCMKAHKLPLVKIHGEISGARPPVGELMALPDVTLTTSSTHDFELTAGGADKGAALAVIAARYGIPLDQCAAVGDIPCGGTAHRHGQRSGKREGCRRPHRPLQRGGGRGLDRFELSGMRRGRRRRRLPFSRTGQKQNPCPA